MRDVALPPAPTRRLTTRRDAPGTATTAAGAAGAAAGFSVVPFLAVLLPLLDRSEPPSLVLGLAGTGLLALVAAGLAPVALVPGLRRGRREAVLPALLVGAGLGAVAVLLSTLLPGTAGPAGARLRLLAPYFAATMAGLGLAQVLVAHRLAAGAQRTVALLAGLAAAVTVGQLVGAGAAAPTADDVVLAAFGGTLTLLVGIGAATVAAAPFSLTVARDRAGEGPRAVGVTLALAIAAGVGFRLAVAGRPAWLDDAAAARLAGDHLPGALERSLAQPHPPLQMVLEWLSRHLFGLSPLALRLPSLLAGVLLVPAVYAAAAELYGRRTALVAALVTAFGPGFVWLSADPGPAALTALLTAVGIFALVRALRRDRPADWALLGLAGAGLTLAHQLGLATVAVLDGAALVAMVRRRRSPGPASGTGAGLALALVITAAAAVPVLVARHGLGPAAALPSAEYATTAAPAGGGTPFGLAGSAVAGLVGFHPPGVTSRLLALWPLGILAAFVVFGRRWSGRGLLLAGLAAAPFLALVLADLAGAPRQPPAALDWVAAALPALAIGVGRTVSLLAGPWRATRLVAAGLVGILALGLVDQTARVRPVARLDLTPVRHALAQTRPGDMVVYEPAALADLVHLEAPGVEAQSVPGTGGTGAVPDDRLRSAGRFVVVAAFPLDPDPAAGVDRTVAVVKAAAAARRAPTVVGTPEVTSWIF